MSPFEPKQFGRYLLIDKLAVGGMAEIYKAKTYGVDGFEKLLAIKRILPHCSADSEFINMLVDEAKLTVLLSHANIVQVYDLGKVGDDYFISMEFINGTNLREVVRRVKEEKESIPEDLAVYIVSEICKGLDYAHRKADPQGKPLAIVHRDINPQNVLISFEGEVKIVDFGIAKAAMNVSHTMAGVLKGKIAYMSPEQALGKPMDGRTDIFSAGLVLYEMLTGEKLFSGDTQFEILNHIRESRITMRDLPEEVPGPLKAIIAKALTHNLKDRFATAGDMHLELTKYLYSSYVDFSPRNLAALVKKYFSQEVRERMEPGPEIDDKTRSLLIKEGAADSLVLDVSEKSSFGSKPREPEADKAQDDPSITEESEIQEEASMAVPKLEAARSKPKGKWAAMLLGVVLAGIGAYFGYEHFKAGPEPIPMPQHGSLIVSSGPSQAKISLNGQDTGQTTPATLGELVLNKEHTIALSKEHYTSFEKTITLDKAEQVKMHGMLEPLEEGSFQISSEPPGAKIFINEKDSGQVTPGTLEKLAIKKSYTIVLKKEGFKDWSQTASLKDFDPLAIEGTLEKIPDPKPEAAVKLADLSVNSSPKGATIYLNGGNTGKKTPSSLKQLKLGKTYSIKLKLDGYKDWSKRVHVGKESGQSVTGTLQKTGDSEKKPPEPEPQPGGMASMVIKSEPSGAEIYINSEFKGSTPATVANIPSGKASVMLSKDGFLRYQTNVSLNGGQKKNLGTIKLESFYGQIVIKSEPPRANVYFDGEKIGANTPVTIRKVPRDRPHSIKVTMGGYKDWSTKADMSKQASKTYNVVLKKN
jgi:serine/threonine protein kinase